MTNRDHLTGFEPARPRVVVIVGSSRFRDYMYGIAQRETLAGKIVLLPGFYHHVDKYPISDKQKRDLDTLMLRKIDLADEVIVCNFNGYIGNSTRRGIEYAKLARCPVRNEWDVPDLVPSPASSSPSTE